MSAPASPALKEASEHWIQLSTIATAKQTEERRKYGQSFTTSADLVDSYSHTQSLPASPFPSSPKPLFFPPSPNGRQSHRSGDGAVDRKLPPPLKIKLGLPETMMVSVEEGTDEADREDEEQLMDSREEDHQKEEGSPSQSRTNKKTDHNYCSRGVVAFRTRLAHFSTKYSNQISVFWKTFFFLLFCAYFGWVISHDPEKGTLLIGLTAFWLFTKVYVYLREYHGDIVMQSVCLPVLNIWGKRHKFVDWVLLGLLLVGLGLFLGLDIGRNPIQLRSILGTVAILTFSYLNSTNPGAVRWRPVIWGIGLQMVMGVIVLRWQPGYRVFFWISTKVQDLLNYADHGAKFIFGDPEFLDHPIAFKVIPMVVFFSAITNMLFYLGAMQVVISKMSWLMQNTMQTTTIESLSVAGNIFFTLTEEAFILRPYMPVLTMSELHAVMVGGSATVAGFALAMYIELGAPPIHVFSAAVMSAPAALAIAKLSYPETEESQTKTEADVQLDSGKEANVLEAAAAGATMSIKVISYAVVIIIAFFGLLGLVNDLLSYAGDLVGHPELSFTLICSYVFFPLAWMLGVPTIDCHKVASIMGMKFFGSDLIAYGQLGELKKLGDIQDRSVMICTYAVLGFSSLSSVGVSIGILGALCPSRRKDVSDLALRAILNGNLASMLTACLAGLLNYS